MPKTRKQKEQTLSQVEADLGQAKSLVFAGYHGLTVADIDALRRELRSERVKFQVIKKTLLQKAFTNQKIEIEAKKIGADLAVAYGLNDEVAPAKLLAKFQKQHEALKIYGGMLENKFIDATTVLSLAKLPNKLELYAKLVGSINAPVAGFVNTLSGALRGLITALNGIKDAKA